MQGPTCLPKALRKSGRDGLQKPNAEPLPSPSLAAFRHLDDGAPERHWQV